MLVTDQVEFYSQTSALISTRMAGVFVRYQPRLVSLSQCFRSSRVFITHERSNSVVHWQSLPTREDLKQVLCADHSGDLPRLLAIVKKVYLAAHRSSSIFRNVRDAATVH